MTVLVGLLFIGPITLADYQQRIEDAEKAEKEATCPPLSQANDTTFVSTKDRKWSSSSLGMRPPEMSTPASMFFSMA